MAYAPAPLGARILAAPLNDASTQLLDTNAKIVHLIRHGEAAHNLLYRQSSRRCSCPDACIFKNPELIDPILTEAGRNDARNAGAHLRRLPLPELCVTSPMMRTAETAMIALHEFDPPCIALEGCRERIGVHDHSKRRTATELAAAFPKIDFTSIQPGVDPYFSHESRESFEELAKRSRGFFWQLQNLPQRVIVVVTHKTFLQHAFDSGLEASTGMRKRFANGEVRAAVLTWLESGTEVV